MKKITLFSLAFLLFAAVLNATTFKVNCDRQDSSGRYPQKIGNVLRTLNPQGPNTLNISGTCKENLTINQFDRLSLIAAPGAMIEDSSEGQEPVINITDSQRITIQGFAIRGGSFGVMCFDGSLCRFSGNTIEGGTNGGVTVNHSQATFAGDIIQDTGGPGGLFVQASKVSGSGVMVQRSAESGIFGTVGSALEMYGMNIKDNGADGIYVVSHSNMQLGGSTISNNVHNGINVNDHSYVLLLQNTVTGNGYNGVEISDSSLVDFGGGGTITGNWLDIGCYGQYSAAKLIQAATYGTTNCSVPSGLSPNAGQTAPRPLLQ